MDSPPARASRTTRWIRAWPSVLLGVAASLGVIALIVLLAMSLLGLRVALIGTGSMAPTMPAGTAALVRAVDAAEVSIGDVVTVDRPGGVPVIHRVVAIDVPAGTDDPVRDLTLRGDANPVDDPSPYRVDRVGLVVLALPGAAPAIAVATTPWALGGFVLLIGAMVVVALRYRLAAPDDADSGDGRDDA